MMTGSFGQAVGVGDGHIGVNFFRHIAHKGGISC